VKIALFEPDGMSLWLFRAELIRRLVAAGHQVHALCVPDEYVAGVAGLGARVVPLEMSRFISPLQDVRLIWRLWRLFRRERYDIVHTFTHKPNIYGAITARLAGCPRVVESVTGLGVLFTYKPGVRWAVARRVFMLLSKLSFAVSHKVAFWNGDIMDRMLAAGLIAKKKTTLIRGSGIDVRRFSQDAVDGTVIETLRQEFGAGAATKYVLMVSRLVWGKGVGEFIDAAEIVARRCPDAVMLLVGQLEEEGHQGVPRTYVESKVSTTLRWLGFRRDVRELMAVADVVVLPSHGEGIPRAMLEAMAMARPIVTTDTFGCRDVVESGHNGLMVPMRDPAALADAIATLLEDDEARVRMGAYGRRKVEREFADDIVVGRMMTELYGLPNG
jgi:N,N'-diacetylbacillosaminyl-diphospho-undecaprenol alpha-1,3-N-acetylgalactosaminyltransferase